MPKAPIKQDTILEILLRIMGSKVYEKCSVHSLKQLDYFNGVLTNFLFHFHLVYLLETALDFSQLRNQSHLRTNHN